MNTAEIKLNFIRKIDSLKANRLQEAYGILLNYLNSKKPLNSWDELSKYEQTAIEEGLAQLDNGKGISHKQVMAKYRKKYDK